MLDRLKSLLKRALHELKVYKLILKDRRTPLLAKILLGMAIVYALSPVDLIPDFIPVLGYLDDVIIIPALVFLALKLTPNQIVQECRLRVESAEALTYTSPKGR